jgi:mannose-6-phosphate isomerase
MKHVTCLPPLLMRPVFVEKLWGGSRISRLQAKQRPGHGPRPTIAVGESWEVADLPEGQSVVDDAAVCAEFAGFALGAMVRRYGSLLVGTARSAERFPLLVKVIDAAEDLSVQVHPGDDYAANHPGTSSKDEAWLVLDAAANARMLHGFVPGVNRALFADAVRKGLPHELMRSVPARRGDVLHVSPGIVHAIGAGVMVLEVQEPSDTTFRVWDFDRVDHSGKKRPLHIDQALSIARFDDQPPPLVARTIAHGFHVLCETRAFSMRAVDVNGARPSSLSVSGETAIVLHAPYAAVVFAWREHRIELMVGATCILPASCGTIVFPALGAVVTVIVMS